MTKRTLYLLGIIITILLGIYFYMTCCSTCGTKVEEEPKNEIVTPAVPDPSSYPFALNDGEYLYSTNDNFNFNTSSATILMPLSTGVENGVESLKTHLAAFPDKVINITGYYTADEENNSAFPNLGLARAVDVKNHLVSKGISSKSINTKGELKDDMVPDGKIYLGPLEYNINTKAVDADAQLDELYQRIKDNPVTLQFNTAQASINLTAEQRQKFADISRYLDKADGASVNVIGHTDNTGQRDTNINLGQERADFAKAYLMRNGIPESKINSSSKGPDEPIATNATEEGRAKNRRTVISLN